MKAEPRRSLVALAISLLLLPAPTVALDFRDPDSGIEGRFSFEAAYGLRLRTQDPDPQGVAIAHGGKRANSGDYDDGTLNYDKGDLTSNMVRLTGETTWQWRNFGAFARAYAFYDYENENNDRQRTDLTAEGRDQVGKDAQLLDAYVSARFEVKDVPLQLRLGEQVVNWGESRFYPSNGVDVTNPLDIPLFQQPTSTLRDLRRPEGMLWGVAHLTPLLIVEAYYQYDWDKTELPAIGTYYSTNDSVSPGARFIQVTGTANQFGTNLSQRFDIPADILEAVGIPAFDPDFYKVTQRIEADRPKNHGQFGITLQSIVPQLNDTKFALYYANYHSKVPTFSAITPTLDAYKEYSQQRIAEVAQSLVLEGADPANASTAAFETQLDYFQINAQYFTDYAEDIQMIGFSMNTTSPRTGTAYFSEISHHIDVPLMAHTGDFLGQILPGANRENPLPPLDLDAISDEEIAEQYASKRFDTAYERDKTFALVGATQFFGSRLGATQSVLNFEVAYLHIWDMPSKSDFLFFMPGIAAVEFEPRSAFATANSWGYRVGGTLIYPNVLGGITLRPRVLFSHDVDGNSPVGVGPFREDRKSFSFGLQGEYIQRLQVDLAYTTFWGAGEWNLLNDRDNLSFSVRYAF